MIPGENPRQAGFAVMNAFNLEAFGTEILAHQRAQFNVIVDDQNSIHFAHFIGDHVAKRVKIRQIGELAFYKDLLGLTHSLPSKTPFSCSYFT